MLLLIGNLSVTEVLVIVLFAVMIFGKRLPEVAVKTAREVQKLRVQLMKAWRETGLQDEIREIRREVDQLPRDLSPRGLARSSAKEAWRRIESETLEIEAPAASAPPAEGGGGEDDGAAEGSTDEPAGAAAPTEVVVSPERPRVRPEPPPRRPDWAPPPADRADARREPPSESGGDDTSASTAPEGGDSAADASPPAPSST